MLIKKKSGLEIPSSEITPEHVYRSRRQFMKGAAALGLLAGLAACRPGGNAPRGRAPAAGVEATPGAVGAPVTNWVTS
jgi:methionine sulfoxide reductase catalytic subunit